MTPARLTPLPDGPYEVTGPLELVDADGEPVQPPAEQVYLCRCGRSATKPFCDGSHARTGWTETQPLMTLVICNMSMSLDGYVPAPTTAARTRSDAAPRGCTTGSSTRRPTRTARSCRSRRRGRRHRHGPHLVRQERGRGRWGDGGPLGDTPCFVVTHDAPTASHPPVYTFVTDGVASAIEQAKAAAGDKDVGLHGATVMQQGLPLGLVDEIHLHVVPVLLGGGTPLFGSLDAAITSSASDVAPPRRRRT